MVLDSLSSFDKLHLHSHVTSKSDILNPEISLEGGLQVCKYHLLSWSDWDAGFQYCFLTLMIIEEYLRTHIIGGDQVKALYEMNSLAVMQMCKIKIL